jgi:hypothetical protein
MRIRVMALGLLIAFANTVLSTATTDLDTLLVAYTQWYAHGAFDAVVVVTFARKRGKPQLLAGGIASWASQKLFDDC